MSTRSTLRCPRCKRASLDTVTSAPYIRGFIVAYSLGSKRLVGCNRCVKKQLASEVGRSLLLGWFSLTSLVVNPICILWNSARLPFLQANPEQIGDLLLALGVSTDSVDMPRVAASLAATMVVADGKVDAQEVHTAIALGGRLIPGFEPRLFHEVVAGVRRLPPTTQLAALLAELLEPRARRELLDYLLAIASADGRVTTAEMALLEAAAGALGVPLEETLRERQERTALQGWADGAGSNAGL
jgi:uncharacterized tellurite resistance protein B-like protein